MPGLSAKRGKENARPRCFSVMAKILFFILLFLVFASMVFLFIEKEGEKRVGAQKEIIMHTDKDEYVEGDSISVSGESTCGNVSLFVDGKEIQARNVDGTFSASLTAVIGAHNITAEGDGCAASSGVTVLNRECSGNETISCTVNGCDGYKPCVDGRFGACRKNKRVCKPGSRMGCSLNSCSFGYMICNECGTGYGHCAPR